MGVPVPVPMSILSSCHFLLLNVEIVLMNLKMVEVILVRVLIGTFVSLLLLLLLTLLETTQTRRADLAHIFNMTYLSKDVFMKNLSVPNCLWNLL